MTSKTSIVWNFFKIKNTDSSIAICNLCNSEVRRGGKNVKSFTTTNLNYHLKQKHPCEVEIEKKRKEQQKSESAQSSQSSSQMQSTSSLQRSQSLQPTLQETLERTKLWGNDHPRTIEMNKVIGELIVYDIRPFSIVEDLGFRRAFKKAIPNYQMPGRTYFSEKVIPNIYDAIKSKIISMLSNCKHISLTSDIWTADTANKDFISISGHWLTDDFDQKITVLKVAPFKDTHTGVHISEHILAGLDEFNIQPNKIHVVVRDNGANMVSGIRLAGLKSQSCFIHTLQLCIKDAILSQLSVKTILDLCRALSTHFHHSSSASAKLSTLQEQLNIKKHKLFSDVSTRWNSTLHMLERMHEQKTAIAAYAADNCHIKNLSQYQWSLVEKLLLMLKAFDDITVECSKRECSLSIIIPTIFTLNFFLSKCEKERDFKGLGTILNELISSVKSRFDPWLQQKELCIACFVDPRFKFKYQSVSKETLQNWIEEEIKLIMDQHVSDSEIHTSSSNVSSSPSPERAKKTLRYSDCVDELEQAENLQQVEVEVASLSHSSTGESSSHSVDERNVALTGTQSSRRRKKAKVEHSIIREIEHYGGLEKLEKKGNPFMWWKTNKTSFPNIALLAQKYLSGPPSSVESERLFSIGGKIYEPSRNRLLPENGEKLMFLHFNLRIFNFDY